MVITLKATARKAGENLTKMREEGIIPAVLYGAGHATTSIAVSLKDFLKVRKEVGESGTFVLELGSEKVTALVHEVTDEPVRSIPQHVDFLAIDVTKPITVNLAIEFTGISPAVKSGNGTLVKVMHEVEVTGLSKDIPHNIVVDLGSLAELDSHIAVADLKLPHGVVALAHATDIVASVSAVKEAVEETATPIDFSAIEVEKKGKKEEDAAAAE